MHFIKFRNYFHQFKSLLQPREEVSEITNKKEKAENKNSETNRLNQEIDLKNFSIL